MLHINSWTQIAEHELEWSYARSSGPGGQNVNKVNSKVVLRWNVLQSTSLHEQQRARILAKLQNRLTRDGSIVIASDRYRDQPRNREDCLEKLRHCIVDALHVPRPRRETRPSRSSVQKAQRGKKIHSLKKSARRKPSSYD